LGVVHQEANSWEQAERYYREAARIKERIGDLHGAANTWNQLAIVSVNADRLDAAETWYRKAIDAYRGTSDLASAASSLNNLALLLADQPERVVEARQAAEEALSIKRTLDPGASAIWTTYSILANIAEKESRTEDAANYRRQARQTKRDFPGTRHEIKQHLPVIVETVLTLTDAAQRGDLDERLADLQRGGWTNLVAAINGILDGQRDPGVLCTNLDLVDTMIVETILQAIDDPTTLNDLLPDSLDQH
jgi:tetratricopeptide (TPR) repeat protein